MNQSWANWSVAPKTKSCIAYFQIVQRRTIEEEFDIPEGCLKLSSTELEDVEVQRFMEILFSENQKLSEDFKKFLLIFTKKETKANNLSEETLKHKNDNDGDETRRKVTAQSIQQRRYKF